MNNWIIINKIKNGSITYSVDDEVILFRRKGNYPSQIEDNTVYTIDAVENDFIIVYKKQKSLLSTLIKVHKTYMIHPYHLRNIKLDILFK